MTTQMKIRIFTTGGTIDDCDYDSEEKAPKISYTLLKEIAKQSRITADYEVEVLMSKDSRFITDKGRKVILDKCKKCKEDKIIITHGTATMALTAKLLGKENLNKTIILTGSAYPTNKKKSDALFNLGFAFASAQLLPNGVYAAMKKNLLME